MESLLTTYGIPTGLVVLAVAVISKRLVERITDVMWDKTAKTNWVRTIAKFAPYICIALWAASYWFFRSDTPIKPGDVGLAFAMSALIGTLMSVVPLYLCGRIIGLIEKMHAQIKHLELVCVANRIAPAPAVKT